MAVGNVGTPPHIDAGNRRLNRSSETCNLKKLLQNKLFCITTHGVFSENLLQYSNIAASHLEFHLNERHVNILNE